MIKCEYANSKDIQLAIRLLDPFQRKYWPKWWPKTELMCVRVQCWIGKQFKIRRLINANN